MEQTAEVRAADRVNLIWVGVIFSALYWVLESVRDVLAFGKGTLMERLFYPDLTSVWMRLLIMFMIMIYGFYAQSVRTSHCDPQSSDDNGRFRVVFSGLFLAIVYWCLEAARDVFIFNKGTLVAQLFYPEAADLSVRLLAVSVLVLFSIYVQNLINERRASEALMRQRQEELEMLVEERTADLQKVNEQLRAEIEGRRRLENALWISRRSFHDIVNATTDAVVVVDKGHRILFANLSFENMSGRQVDELIGESFSLPLNVGQRSHVMVRNSGGATEAEMRVMESEWEGASAFLVLLHPLTTRSRVDHQVLV
ncbi:MAG TPA: PAS domain-containing protein [Acidobacteriota bacterium]|nr:PAS domain-containing protein [Acidobacteriota bacterium]